MQRIYTNAASVVVWLGPENESSRAAMELIIEHNGPGGNEKVLLQHKHESLRALSDIFLRTWFKRIWIIQEVVAARELVIFCGQWILPWNFLSKVCTKIRKEEFSPDGKSHLLRGSGHRNFTVLNDFRRGRSTMSLTKYLQCTKDYQASDPRDKLYALIGLACDISPDDIIPDYAKSIKTVFLGLVRFLVTKRGSLDIISSGRLDRPTSTTPLGRRLRADEIIPSWLPDWSPSQDLRPLNSEEVDTPFYRAGGGTVAVVRMNAFPHMLEVEGIVVDKIDFFGGAIKSPARESIQTIRRWQYIAGQHLTSDSNFGVVTPPGFLTTIVAGKNCMAGCAHGTQSQSENMIELCISGEGSQTVGMSDYFSDAVTRAVMGPRFFITAKKRMGLGVPEVQLRDRVVVLKGCSVPLIMRAVGDHMVIVGESYVSGIMGGEVMEDLAKGRYKTRMIRLQ
ncbi:hypothetical protein Daus18300_003239 [Diaporthe australafricana]|uniref:Heterokaryon incompatibility domain-containing protein n=1 Tax=Diaporthe australafricana TaxID=127596 RepID=A0ABR3XHH1_9PEZI